MDAARRPPPGRGRGRRSVVLTAAIDLLAAAFLAALALPCLRLLFVFVLLLEVLVFRVKWFVHFLEGLHHGALLETLVGRSYCGRR